MQRAGQQERQVLETKATVAREHVNPTVDGEREFLETKFPILDGDEAAVGLGIISIDVTERRRMERALRDSEQRYRTLVERMNEGVGIADTEMRITYVNERFCEMLGSD